MKLLRLLGDLKALRHARAETFPGALGWSVRDRQKVLDRLKEEFDPAFYLHEYPDVAAARVDPLLHYRTSGWREGRKPNDQFDPVAYFEQHPDLKIGLVDPFLHFLANRQGTVEVAVPTTAPEAAARPAGEEAEQPPAQMAPTEKPIKPPTARDIELVRTEFDPAYYLKVNPDLRSANGGADGDPLLHFMTTGWVEERNPCSEFSVSYYLRNNPDIARDRVNPYVHYLRHGRHEKWRKSAPVAIADVQNKFAEGSAMHARVAEAVALDPMVALPDGARQVTSPLIGAKHLTDAVEALRQGVGARRFPTIIAVPHIRMSGAARVAAILTTVLAGLRDPKDLLVVTTDSPEDEYAFWLPDAVERLNLSDFMTGLGPEHRMRCLLDLMRGVECETLINANSRLAWDMLTVFGRQITQEVRVVTYLFTWDETQSGARVGYPIQWLRDTCDFHHLLFTDSKALAKDVRDRLGFDAIPGGPEVVALYTPVDAPRARARPLEDGTERPRFLWAGRFDRQKRVDVLVEIARSLPEFDFDVYGKAVLDKKGLQDFHPPNNLFAKGTYRDLADVLETPYAGFLYTAQWDGIPTILLDMGLAGLPMVAPDVGGIGELIDSGNGWLIPDFTDIAGYAAALKEMAADPAEATRRAAQMKQRIAVQFSREQYSSILQEAMTRHGI